MLKRIMPLLLIGGMLLSLSSLAFGYTPGAPAPLQYVASGDRSCVATAKAGHTFAKIKLTWHTSSETVTANVIDAFGVAQINLDNPSRKGDKARVNYDMFYRFHVADPLRHVRGSVSCRDSG